MRNATLKQACLKLRRDLNQGALLTEDQAITALCSIYDVSREYARSMLRGEEQ